MTKTKTSTDNCVACVGLRQVDVKDIDDAFTVGMAIGVGIENCGLTPTFCDKHRALLKNIGDKLEQVTTSGSIQ